MIPGDLNDAALQLRFEDRQVGAAGSRSPGRRSHSPRRRGFRTGAARLRDDDGANRDARPEQFVERGEREVARRAEVEHRWQL